MNLSILLRTFWCGRLVGEDDQGNKYYEDKKVSLDGKRRRWVIYKGNAEASKVPASWHGWLHFTTSSPNLKQAYSWEKPHTPNLTGTDRAHKPKSQRDIPPQKDYQAWRPE